MVYQQSEDTHAAIRTQLESISPISNIILVEEIKSIEELTAFDEFILLAFNEQNMEQISFGRALFRMTGQIIFEIYTEGGIGPERGRKVADEITRGFASQCFTENETDVLVRGCLPAQGAAFADLDKFAFLRLSCTFQSDAFLN